MHILSFNNSKNIEGYIRALDIWNISCTYNDKNASLYFLLTSKLHMMLLSTIMLVKFIFKVNKSF